MTTVRFTIRIIACALISLALLVPAGCGCAQSERSVSSSSSSGASSSFKANEGTEDDEHSLTEQIEGAYSEAAESVDEFLDSRKNSQPTYLAFGKEAQVTKKLAVTVTGVEEGPYDVHRQCATMKVSVRVRNLADTEAIAKCLNFAADTTGGARKEVRKTWIRDTLGQKLARTSLLAVRISPNAAFEGDLYFDADGIADILYRPSLASSQNQYFYWGVG